MEDNFEKSKKSSFDFLLILINANVLHKNFIYEFNLKFQYQKY